MGNSEALAETGTKPDEIPTTLGVTVAFVSCVQGWGNVDWVAVWFFEVLFEILVNVIAILNDVCYSQDKGDDISGISGDVGGVVGQRAILADHDGVSGRGRNGESGDESNGRSEQHFGQSVLKAFQRNR